MKGSNQERRIMIGSIALLVLMVPLCFILFKVSEVLNQSRFMIEIENEHPITIRDVRILGLGKHAHFGDLRPGESKRVAFNVGQLGKDIHCDWIGSRGRASFGSPDAWNAG